MRDNQVTMQVTMQAIRQVAAPQTALSSKPPRIAAIRRDLPVLAGFCGVAMSAALLVVLWPHARDAGALLAARDDPAALSDLQLDMALDRDPLLLQRNIETALAAGDADLAQSFVDLAVAHNMALPEGVVTRVRDAVAAEQSTMRLAQRFGRGLLIGEADDIASLSGTVAGDLFVFGDIRDAVRETGHLIAGEPADRVVLGLAAAGLAITAGTYLSVGGVAPARTGLTLVKDARKAGRIGAGLGAWAGRSARDMIDLPALRQAMATGSLARPVATMAALKTAFRSEKAVGLLRLTKDVGRIGEKAGTKGALQTLRLAEGPGDVARAARLAAAKGGKTRAILKLLGRGALLLAAGTFNLALWLFGALLMMLSLLGSIKSLTERLTLAWLRRAKRRRACKIARVVPPPLSRLVSATLPG